MSGARIFLGISVLIWLPYGIYCFVDPAFLEGAAGVVSTTPTGTIEIQAMYGGLQAGVGAFAAAALFRRDLEHPALMMIIFLCGGLFSARVLAALSAGEVSAYTGSALIFEIGCSALAMAAVRSRPSATQTADA